MAEHTRLRAVLIGKGAIARYVANAFAGDDSVEIAAHIVRPGSRADALPGKTVDAADYGAAQAALGFQPDVLVDCAGHGALKMFGPGALAAGTEMLTVSAGALADRALEDQLLNAALRGGSHLGVVPGAIGALDVLSAAKAGGLERVVYTGRKPPKGWAGSPAEAVADLGALTEPLAHFRGHARDAALQYPKNANVAAAVALAGPGFEATEVVLIADPGATANTHEITAEGAFGAFRITVEGRALPDNPRSSALAAMSVVAALRGRASPIRIGA